MNVPDGRLRERLAELLDGRRWTDLREAALASECAGLPGRWDRAVRWYRRASRERRPRETIGAVVAAILDELRGVATAGALRRRYRERDGDWASTVMNVAASATSERRTCGGWRMRPTAFAGWSLRTDNASTWGVP